MASSTSSSSASLGASANNAENHPHTDRTIGLAVGLGVGIPILLTIIVLAWVTVRHHRKMREEDEIHKEIDFNGDVSFWPDEGITHFDRRQDDLPAAGSSNNTEGNTTMTTTCTGTPVKTMEKSRYVSESTVAMDQESRASDDTQSLSSHAALSGAQAKMAHLSMYTPEFMFSQGGSQENFSKTLNTVYGPAPAYPSTEKLRAPSVASLRSQHTGNNAYSGSMYNGSMYNGSVYNGSTYSGYNGPFATPPRHMDASPHNYPFRRMSTGSAAAATDDASSLAGEGEVPHMPGAAAYSGAGSLYSGSAYPGAAYPGAPHPGAYSGSSYASSNGHSNPNSGSGLQTPVQTPSLGLLRESPHPYAEMAGEPTVTSLQNAVAHQATARDSIAPSEHTTDDRESANFEDASSHQEKEKDADDDDEAADGETDQPRRTRHAYHQEARDRTSQFEFI